MLVELSIENKPQNILDNIEKMRIVVIKYFECTFTYKQNVIQAEE